MIHVLHHMYCDNEECQFHREIQQFDRNCQTRIDCMGLHRNSGWVFARWGGREWHFCCQECKDAWRDARDIPSNNDIAAIALASGSTTRTL